MDRKKQEADTHAQATSHKKNQKYHLIQRIYIMYAREKQTKIHAVRH